MLRCIECSCVSEQAPGWIAMLSGHPEDDEWPEVVIYCPPCAAREFAFSVRAPYT